MANNILNTLNDIKNKSDKDKAPAARASWDPKGNRHCFNKGFGPSWWDRNGNSLQDEFHADPMVLLRGAGLDFMPRSGLAGTYIEEENRFQPTLPKTYNVLRGDRPEVTLQVGVGSNYSLKPYSEIIQIPDSVTIKISDFEDPKVKDFLQAQNPDLDLSDEDLEFPVNQLLMPAGCSSWQDGRKMTFQYYIGAFEPRPGDKHIVFLNIESSLDGSKATRYYLTVVRVVCENTQLHAEQDGWNKLLGSVKNKQRIRRTGRMEARIGQWHENISNVLIGAVQTAEVFKMLSQTKISENNAKRKSLIESFVTDLFDLKTDGMADGNARTRKINQKQAILEQAIFEDSFGGGKCETLMDLWNGLTSWNQHFVQVNGLDKQFKLEEERRYFQILTNDTVQAEFGQQFVRLMQFAEKVA